MELKALNARNDECSLLFIFKILNTVSVIYSTVSVENFFENQFLCLIVWCGVTSSNLEKFFKCRYNGNGAIISQNCCCFFVRWNVCMLQNSGKNIIVNEIIKMIYKGVPIAYCLVIVLCIIYTIKVGSLIIWHASAARCTCYETMATKRVILST